MKRFLIVMSILLAVTVLLTGCGKKTTSASDSSRDETLTLADTSGMDFTIDDSDTEEKSADTGKAVDLSETEGDSQKITAGGTYTLSGTKTDTTVLVDAKDADVTLILNGLTVKNSNGPAIYVRSADKVTVTLAAGTVNTLSDGSSYSLTDSGSTLDAAIFSKADLTINGSGTLTVNGNYKHAIVSKDDLTVASGTLNIAAKNVGLNGKDCVKIGNGNITVNAGSDGIRSDNDEDTQKGYVYLSGGTLNITAGNDGIQAQTVIKAEGVTLSVKAGGGSGTSLSSSSESYKGMKAGSDIYISGGTFQLSAKDDCIHSNGTITIEGGTYTLSSGDDGIHADTDLKISGASTKLTVSKSYEGIEATNLYITDGTISVTASDDGLNAAGGNAGGEQNRPGMGSFSGSTGKIVISGGTLYIKQGGDGIDANGSVSVTGGSITVSGANSGDTSILDYDTSGSISGGSFIGTGASSMAQNFDSSSSQGVILYCCSSQSAGTGIKLTDSSGKVVLSRTSDQAFSCVILSDSAIQKGETYTLTIGSSSVSITMSDIVYSNGASGGPGGMGGGPGGGRPGGRQGMR